MHSTFWSNTIWYVLLGITTIISIVLILLKSINRKFIIGFGLAVLSLTFHIEIVLLLISNAYAYFPKLSSVPYFDSSIGNFFSQFSVASTAVLAIKYKLSIIWNFIIAGIYFLIEELFVKLGIYQHGWYRSWYTFIGILLLLWIVKKWYYYLLNSPKPFIINISVFLGARALFIITCSSPFYLFYLVVFNIKPIFDEFNRNQGFYTHLYSYIIIIIMLILYRLKLKWIWKGAALIFLFILQYILIKNGFIIIKNGYFWVVTLLYIFGGYFDVVVADYLLSKGIHFSSQEKI